MAAETLTQQARRAARTHTPVRIRTRDHSMHEGFVRSVTAGQRGSLWLHTTAPSSCAACDHPGPTVPSELVPGARLCADAEACLRRSCPPRPKPRPLNGERRR